MVLPWIFYQEVLTVVEAADEMSDIQFLAIKEFGGKLRNDTGTLPVSTTGDLGTLTANGGKDMYLGRAHASITVTGGSPGNIEIVLRVNGVIKDRWFTSANRSVNIGGHMGNTFEFAVGFKVTATQIIKLEVITASAGIQTSGTVECWEENTGTSPQIPPLNPV